MELVAHVDYEMGGDLQFQRRTGPHLVSGVAVETMTDLAFASAHSDISRTDGGIEIIDITNPAAAQKLARIPCPGYQSDVAAYENLLIQTIDDPRSNVGCDPAWLRSSGSADVDQTGVGGVRIFDVTDPARPKLIHFQAVVGSFGEGVHDVTVLGWVGIAYLAQLNGELGILDLKDPDFAYTPTKVTSISPGMKASCHDVGLDPVRLLAFCPDLDDATYILDIRVPAHPTYVGKIVNAALSRHHGALLAPDGSTLVVQSEYDHPPEIAGDASAGLWFYNLAEPTRPVILGSWAPKSCKPDEQADRACSSHWYNFVPGTQLVVAAWRHEGLFVVDYSNPAAPTEKAHFRSTPRVLTSIAPTDFWTAYFWHGYVYGSAKGTEGGLYVLRFDGLTDAEPSPYDEGTSWGRWTPKGGVSYRRVTSRVAD